MSRRQNLVSLKLLTGPLVVGLSLVALAAWLHYGLLGDSGRTVSLANNPVANNNDDPDYYIENFTSTGIDNLGKKYRLSAARLVHYPAAGEAVLERPRIVQYQSDGHRRITADSGRLYDASGEVRLSGNVRVVDGQNGAAGGAVVTSQTMLVRLKGGRG